MNKFQEYIATLYFVVRLFICYPKVAYKWFFGHERPRDEKSFEKSSKKGLYVHFNTFHRFKIKPSKTITKYIYGNYENYDYFKDIIDELREDFEINEEMNSQNKKVHEELSTNESVCVHIRRGDYLDPKWSYLNVCSFEYYQKGINEIERRHPNAKFYIFSNTHEDIEWIKTNYKFEQRVQYIDLNNKDYEELELMKACNHFVISNSTFSWWAAVLSKREGKEVVIPDRWVSDAPIPGINYNEKKEYKGLYLSNWIKIETGKKNEEN